jgi:hypothetical protein
MDQFLKIRERRKPKVLPHMSYAPIRLRFAGGGGGGGFFAREGGGGGGPFLPILTLFTVVELGVREKALPWEVGETDLSSYGLPYDPESSGESTNISP